jgi:muramoyltetrapeptide carboxypeptidase
MLQCRGYEVMFGDHAFEREGFLAGTDRNRADDLLNAWFDESIAAVICSRGGYGMHRLLPLLDLEAMAAKPKLLVGFSDTTALHLALNRLGLATLYAPMLLSFAKDRAPWVREMWFHAMEGSAKIALPPNAARGRTVNGGTVTAEVTGGCLCLLADSIGTPNPAQFAGRIVIIEDVDEHAYRVDAMLTHLLAAGCFRDVRGIVVGEMTRTDEMADPSIASRPWREVVIERLSGLDVPMITDFPFGHGEHMLSMPLGVNATLDADAGEMRYEEIGVSI